MADGSKGISYCVLSDSEDGGRMWNNYPRPTHLLNAFLLEYGAHHRWRGFAVCADQGDRPPDAAGVVLAVNPYGNEMFAPWL